MIKKMKKNALLVAIVATLFGLGAKNVASAAQVASVSSTRYEIWYVYGGSRTTYLVMYCFFLAVLLCKLWHILLFLVAIVHYYLKF